MGLAERRIIKEFQEGAYKNLVSEINQLIGFNIEFDVDWNSLMSNEYSDIWDTTFSKVYFQPLLGALKSIAEDDMGKEALKDSLHKIVIKDESDNSSARNTYKFENGVLVIDHSSYMNADFVEERTGALTEVLEKNL